MPEIQEMQAPLEMASGKAAGIAKSTIRFSICIFQVPALAFLFHASPVLLQRLLLESSVDAL